MNMGNLNKLALTAQEALAADDRHRIGKRVVAGGAHPYAEGAAGIAGEQPVGHHQAHRGRPLPAARQRGCRDRAHAQGVGQSHDDGRRTGPGAHEPHRQRGEDRREAGRQLCHQRASAHRAFGRQGPGGQDTRRGRRDAQEHRSGLRRGCAATRA